MRRRRRNLIVNSVLGLILLAVVVTAVLVLTGGGDDAAAAGTTTRTSTAQLGDVSATVAASGQVAAVRAVDADFTTSGTVATVDVAVGQTVTAGQRLGTLDTGDAQDAVDEAQDAYDAAVDDYDDAKTAYADAQSASGTGATGSQGGSSAGGSTVTASTVTQAKEKVTSTRSALDDAEEALSGTTLTAPIAGLVTAVNGTVGASSGSSSGGSSSGGQSSGAVGSTTASSSAFVTIADTSAYPVAASFAEADIAALAVGQAATVTFPAVDGVTGTAKVTTIAPTATTSNNVVSYAATITLDALPDGIRIGQSAQISVTTASATNVLGVPSAAVTSSGTGDAATHSVTVVADDGTRTRTTVEIGVQGDSTTEITSGLTEGQKVLISVDTATGSGTSGTTQRGTGGFGGAGGFGGGAGGGGGFGGGAGGFGG